MQLEGAQCCCHLPLMPFPPSPQHSPRSDKTRFFVTAAWGANDTHMMTEEEMAARDQALMGEHSSPDSVAISIPEDFTKSVPPQVGLELCPACAPTRRGGAIGGNSPLADAQIGHQESWLQSPGDRQL